LILWRITRSIHSSTPLDGEGSRLNGGRWNRSGVALAATSEHLSLAVLEYLVHADIDILPTDLVVVRVSVPATLTPQSFNLSLLPSNWRDYPSPPDVQNIGDEWQRKNSGLLLRVPSAILPTEHSVLVNPLHSDFPKLSCTIEPFALDPRFARK
jgi:RES domain-containing protein